MDADLRELLDQREALLKGILHKTAEIQEALTKNREEKLLSTLEERQELMKKVDDLDNRIRDYPGKGQQHRGLHRQILRDIVEMDVKNREMAAQMKSEITSEILKLKKTGEGMRGYGFSERPSREGAFIDTRE